MNAILQRVSLKLSDWSDDLEKLQSEIPFDHPTGFKDYIERRVHSGKARIIDVLFDGKKIGFIAYEIHCNQGRELYILAVHIEGKGVDWTDYLDALTDRLARDFKCTSKSCSTNRAGLIQKLTDRGFRVAEVTLRKNVN